MTKLYYILNSGNQRRSGRTHSICVGAASSKAIVIVRDQNEATRIKQTYGVDAFPLTYDLGDKLRGKKRPILFDTDVVNTLLQSLDRLQRETALFTNFLVDECVCPSSLNNNTITCSYCDLLTMADKIRRGINFE